MSVETNNHISPELHQAAEDLGAVVHQNRYTIIAALENYARIQETVGVSNRKINEVLAELLPAIKAFTAEAR